MVRVGERAARPGLVDGRTAPDGTNLAPGLAGRYIDGMRVVVDFDLCESNALCMAAAPEVFEVRDDDFLYVLQEEPPEELREKVEAAVRACPKAAITIVD
jgi:ferredoxin